jgi:hypothetical protein
MHDPSPPPDPTTAPTGRARWLDRGFLLATILACAVAVSPNLADPDLWGHVKYGRDVLAEGKIPATTTYAYSVENFRWINHEHLSELIFAVGAATVGGMGLLVMKCLLGVFVVLLIVLNARRQGAQLITTCVLALLVAVNLTYHWSVRPQIFTFTFYAALLALVTWCFQGWEGNWHLPWLKRAMRADPDRPLSYVSPRLRCLWIAPLIFFVWANTHGGFVAGYCIYAALLVCRGVEAVFARGWQAAGLLRRLGLMIFVAGLATLINPYGPGLQAWLLRSLGEPRPEIAEWHAIGWNSPHFLPFVLLVAVAMVALIGSRRPRDFAQLAVLGLTLWQALEHQRHIPFFALAAGFWLPQHIESWLARWQKEPAHGALTAGLSPTMRRVLAAGLLIAYVLLGYRLYDRLHMLRVERDRYPVAALQYMVDHNLHGRLVVTFNWAQYAIAALDPYAPEPGAQVGFDGRFRTCYPQEIVDMHFDFILGDTNPAGRQRLARSGPIDGGRVLRHGHPQLVLIDRSLPHSVQVMRQSRDQWVLLYQDPVAELWGLAARYDRPTSGHYVPPHERLVSRAPQTGAVAWPALPLRRGPQPTVVMK